MNAGGIFAPEIGAMVGVTVPLIPMAHQYLFTEAIEGVHAGLPQLRDPDNLVYFREEVGGLCMGGYERDPAPWALDGVPSDFNGKLLAPDMPRFQSIMEGAIRRVPAMEDARVSRVINGPEAFTPDNEFILGESEVRGFWVAAGFSAHGIAGAGRHRSAGGDLDRRRRTGARSLEDGHPAVRAAYRSQAYTLARSIENYATYYDIHYPNEERQAGRPLRTSPTYETLAGAGCGLRREVRLGAPELVRAERRRPRFGSRRRSSGSDRGAGPGGTGRRRSPPRRWRRGRPAALFDETSFAKLEVSGPGACAFLQRVGRATTSIARSGRSSTRSCSTGAAGSRPT